MITILQLNEQTRCLVEDLIRDFGALKTKIDQITVLENRCSNIDQKMVEIAKQCEKCSNNFLGEYKEIRKLVYENKDKFFDFELNATKEHTKIKEDIFDVLYKENKNIVEKVEGVEKSFGDKFHSLDKVVTINSFKISGIAFIILTVLKFLFSKIIQHAHLFNDIEKIID